MKNKSDLKSKQNEVRNHDFNEVIRALSSSLQEKEATAAQLQSELQKYQQVASTQLLGFIKLTIEITEVECKLHEAEYQKQQADLERKVQVQKMKNREIFKAELHLQLGELSCHQYFITSCVHCPLFCSDERPKVTSQPTSLSKVCPGTAILFTVQANGTEPLSYHWQWMPAEEEEGSEKWQPCPAEWSDGTMLTIPCVQKSNEGSYHCIVSNYAGSLNSNPANLSVGKNPGL